MTSKLEDLIKTQKEREEQAVRNYQKNAEMEKERVEKAIEEAALIVAMLETDGGKTLINYLEETIKLISLSPEKLMIQKTTEEEGDMEFVFDKDRAVFLAGGISYLKQILNYFSDCDTVIREKANRKQKEENKN